MILNSGYKPWGKPFGSDYNPWVHVVIKTESEKMCAVFLQFSSFVMCNWSHVFDR